MHPEDQRFYQGIKSQNEGIIRELYVEMKGFIKASIYKYAHLSQADSEDIYHDAFLKLLEKVNEPNFQLCSRFKSYLFGIARNLWMKEWNRQHRMNEAVQAILHTPIEGLSEEDALEIESKLDRENCDQLLSRYILRLNDLEKEIIQLYYFEKKKLADIDQILGKGKNYSRLRKFRMMSKMRKWIEENPRLRSCWKNIGNLFKEK